MDVGVESPEVSDSFDVFKACKETRGVRGTCGRQAVVAQAWSCLESLVVLVVVSQTGTKPKTGKTEWSRHICYFGKSTSRADCLRT